MSTKDCTTSLFVYFLLSSFCLWSWIYAQKSEHFEKEQEKGALLAASLAASNAMALQAQLEGNLSLNGVDKLPGVIFAFIIDSQGRVLAPLSHYGEIYSQPTSKKYLFISKPILGIQKEFLGEAILIFDPILPAFYSLWLLFFIPPLFAGAIYYLCQKRSKKKSIVSTPNVTKNGGYTWLPVLASWLESSLYVFDDQGNIIAASMTEKPNHLLDLFPETSKAQKVLSLIHQLKGGNIEFPENDLGNILLSKLDLYDGTKHYLLASN